MRSRKGTPVEIRAEIYLQDPLVAQQRPALGLKEIRLGEECEAADGPTSSRLVVVDYAVDQDKLFEPARLTKDRTHFIVRPGTFQFHQVNAWAVANETLRMYENPKCLGRRLPWGFDGYRLTILPHAGYWQNAFYDRQTGTLQFFYFEAEGKTVYTCLAHDIVSHETGHAILDGIRPLYNEISSPDTAGFHEYIGDISAILTAFSHREIAAAVIGLSGGNLRKDTLVAALAEEFGAALYGDAQRQFLRNAINDLTMAKLQGNWEPHDYSQVLTGTMYEILIRMYDIQWDEEKKRARRQGHKPSPVKALIIAVKHFSRMALRALDYGPPADIQFREYGSTMLLADRLAYPIDKFEYRKMASEVFAERGIVSSPADLSLGAMPDNMDFNLLSAATLGESDVSAYSFLDANRSVLGIPGNQAIRITGYYTNAKTGDFDYRLPLERVVSYYWEEDVLMKGKEFGRFDGSTLPLFAGGTLVFDDRGNVLSWIRKDPTEERKERLLKYVQCLLSHGLVSIKGDDRFGASAPVLATLSGRSVRLERSAAHFHTYRRN